ncbi:MAG TPA: DUF4148 domain-containing protein [Ramlibacter sp.]|uniref:DUF4148 domain-containing protein n=1 Tax=Ramlibacter sp. TaxID=1917967 RepID=UPI002D7FF1C2|nr:DUF4148 domain-containing protein [Ramlibacter sp.]HET8745114.1 DUF4148 domain-containing protein [Ramlibacter sp.]
MNRKITLTFAAASLVAASAFAETPMTDSLPFKASLTRAQVQAELAQHRSTGIDPYADGYNPLHEFRSTRTRAEVQAEFLAERALVSALNGEDSGSGYLAHRALPRAVGPQMAALPVAE